MVEVVVPVPVEVVVVVTATFPLLDLDDPWRWWCFFCVKYDKDLRNFAKLCGILLIRMLNTKSWKLTCFRVLLVLFAPRRRAVPANKAL
jgi:hypothetical protein